MRTKVNNETRWAKKIRMARGEVLLLLQVFAGFWGNSSSEWCHAVVQGGCHGDICKALNSYWCYITPHTESFSLIIIFFSFGAA